MPSHQGKEVAQMRGGAEDNVHADVAMDCHTAFASTGSKGLLCRRACDGAALRARLLVPGLAGGGDCPCCPALPGAARIQVSNGSGVPCCRSAAATLNA